SPRLRRRSIPCPAPRPSPPAPVAWFPTRATPIRRPLQSNHGALRVLAVLRIFARPTAGPHSLSPPPLLLSCGRRRAARSGSTLQLGHSVTGRSRYAVEFQHPERSRPAQRSPPVRRIDIRADGQIARRPGRRPLT